ncbi:MAG: hypothetical protein AB1486_31395 [Planctomycetota bacterium]
MSSRTALHSRRVLLLVAGIVILGLAGVVSPFISTQSEDAARGRALADLTAVARALDAYLKLYAADTLADPASHEPLSYLAGPGDLPSNNTFDSGPGGRLDEILGRVALDLPGADPWGRAYLVNLGALHEPSEYLIVLCAGPNGQVNSRPDHPLPGGDDLLIIVD